MVYIGPDGNVSDTKPRRTFGLLTDLFMGLYNFFSLLFSSLTGNPNRIQRADPDLNIRRNRVRGGNVRNLKNLGTADAKCGSGG